MRHIHLIRYRFRFIVTKQYLSTMEAGKYLGISEKQIRRLIQQKQIPYYQPVDGVYLLKKLEIDKWVTLSRIGTIAEIEDEKLKRQFVNCFSR